MGHEETYKTNGAVRFKPTMLKFSLCDFSDPCILVKGRITVTSTTAAFVNSNNRSNT